MRNIILSSVFLIFSATSCETQSSAQTATLKNTLQTDQFVFNAEYVNITNPDVSQVLSKLPGSSASQTSHLSPGYTMKVSKDLLTCDLPYFGRMYNPSFDNSKNGLHFESKDFELQKKLGKNGKMLYSFYPKDVQNIRRINVEMYNNGKAYVMVDAMDRQPATYEGYITAN